ncbi:MAG: Flp family type IVb pilin [Alphaproteobacteria bacterium]|nr:Flp family type IVb pilin [Alphaproteobacteria bacterium]
MPPGAQRSRIVILTKHFQWIKSNDRGATAIEYGLITMGVGLAIVVVVFGIGSDLDAFFEVIRERLQNPPS